MVMHGGGKGYAERLDNTSCTYLIAVLITLREVRCNKVIDGEDIVMKVQLMGSSYLRTQGVIV